MNTAKEEFEKIYLTQYYLFPTTREAFNNSVAIWKSKYPFQPPFNQYDTFYRWQYYRNKKK